MTLHEAIEKTLTDNPQIMQAAQNREAVEFELRQARGLYLPTIDFDSSTGARRLEGPTERALGNGPEELYPTDAGITITQTLFDGGERRAEVEAQASRVDGASFRVLERSESLALRVVQDYLEYMLQAQIVAEAGQNVGFHRNMIGNIKQSIQGGTLTDADLLQGEERLSSAQAKLRQAQEELEAANIRFRATVGQPIGKTKMPPPMSKFLPATLDEAIFVARENNPRVYSAGADVDAADANVRGARANYLPKVYLEGTARTGNDVNGDEGNTNDLQGRIVAKWNLYRGGIDVAREQERIRRASEQRYNLHQVHREVEESVRSSWNERSARSDLAKTLGAQSATNAQLVSSYQEQFQVGKRSLLDVLDAQNTKFNVGVLAKTAQYASLFAQYKILAASGSLVKSLGLKAVSQSDAYARQEFGVQSLGDNPGYKEIDSHQTADMPIDLLTPIRQK
ncbi:TolC family outer membrane protein (plasmid) [Sinorhizobium sp. BG8]|nr:TolC family outer membrane protein [Sinorhizobium sp. BG8]